MAATTQTIDKHVQVENRIPLIIVLMVGNFIALINETVMNVALPNIEETLGIQTTTAHWLSTGYMLTIGILIPISAYLMQRFTTRQLLLTALSFFFIGTLIAGFAPNFSILLLGRVIQASGSGIIIPLVTTVIITITPLAKRGSMLGLLMVVILFAPAIGPVFSGLVVEQASWRYVFISVLPVTLVLLGFAAYFVRNVLVTKRTKIDILSVVLAVIGFGSIVIGFSSAGAEGWTSPLVLGALIIGLAAIAYFAYRQFNLETPMLDLRPYKNKNFLMAILVTITVMMCFFAAMILLPIFMQDALGISAFDSGIVLFPGGIMIAIMALLTGRLSDRFGPKPFAITGTVLLVAMIGLMTTISTDTTMLQFTLLYVGFTFAIGLILTPMTTLGLNQLTEELYSHGSASLNAFNQISGAIGPALFITLMSGGSQAVASHSADQAMTAGLQFAFTIAGAFAVAAVVFVLLVKQSKPIHHYQYE
ncbi:MDR family MFS transporter [Terribacillus saccharophilus]|uniref:MDR family MFS transporter n=1 Tax=Terribacillus saccharophilus TaxID=361277 RepID=UPI002DD0C55E|nr:DHA2 family efflux MFS transporter permease subunit [Terribacillus saccharophilus]MEC0291105.1 DHA2 family efflux MFS transporter permease subunit [Terribacillus saccharophilus]